MNLSPIAGKLTPQGAAAPKPERSNILWAKAVTAEVDLVTFGPVVEHESTSWKPLISNGRVEESGAVHETLSDQMEAFQLMMDSGKPLPDLEPNTGIRWNFGDPSVPNEGWLIADH